MCVKVIYYSFFFRFLTMNKTDPSEKVNLQAQNPEIVKEMTYLLKKYIEEGRSTPGKPQKNDSEYPWKQIQNLVK